MVSKGSSHPFPNMEWTSAMATQRGLLAGFGDPALAGAPMAIAGAGLKSAVDTGLKAYGEVSSIRQRDEALELQGQEGARAEKRLSMAEQLLPGQLTAQELANKDRAQTVEAVGQRMTREEAQRKEAARVIQDVISGKITDPLELQFQMGTVTLKGGNSEHMGKWLSDYESMLKTGKKSEHERGLLKTWMDASVEQSKSPKDPMVWGRAALTMMEKWPLATPTSPTFKMTIDSMNKAVDAEFPGPVADGFKEYIGMRSADPKLSPAQAWSQVQSKMDPSFHAKFNSLMPPDVKLEYGAMAKGAEEKAGAEAKLPSKLKEIEATGAQQRALEQEKERSREKRAQLPSKALEKLLADSTKRVGQIEGRLKDPFLATDARASLEADRTAAIQERREYAESLAVAQTREGAEKPPAGALDPKKVRAEKIGPITVLLRQKAKNLEDSKRALDHNLRNQTISQAEYDQLLAAETKRWGGK